MFSDNSARPLDGSSAYSNGNDIYNDMFPELQQFSNSHEFQSYLSAPSDAISNSKGAADKGHVSMRDSAARLQSDPSGSVPGHYVANNDFMLLDSLNNDINQTYGSGGSGLFS